MSGAKIRITEWRISMTKKGTEPVCNKGECFACKDRHCAVLTDNNFGNRQCPFFKTDERLAMEQKMSKARSAKYDSCG